MNDVNQIIGSPAKTVLRTTPKVPTFKVSSKLVLVANINYSELNDHSSTDKIIEKVKKSYELPPYDVVVAHDETKLIRLYSKVVNVTKE